MDSALFLRFAAGKYKNEVLTLANEGVQVHKPEDVENGLATRRVVVE